MECVRIRALWNRLQRTVEHSQDVQWLRPLKPSQEHIVGKDAQALMSLENELDCALA